MPLILRFEIEGFPSDPRKIGKAEAVNTEARGTGHVSRIHTKSQAFP